MSADPVLQVIFDTRQKRMIHDRLVMVAAGLDFANQDVFGSRNALFDTWIEPISNYILLRPYCVRPEWHTTSTGNYAKLTKSDFGLGSDWEDRADQSGSGNWIAKKDSSTNAVAISSTTWSKNRGFSLAWFAYGDGSRFVQMSCGWNNAGNNSSGVSVDFWSDGTVEVYKDAVLIDSGKISGGSSSQSQANSVWEVVLLPYNHNCLLVCSLSTGDGFFVTFEDIEEDDTNPTITGATKFWWHVKSGATQVQVAPVKFPSSGYAISRELSFNEPPATGETPSNWTLGIWPGPGTFAYNIYGRPAYVSTQGASASLVNDTGAPFVPNGVRTIARIKVTLTTSDTGYSPTVQGALVDYLAQSDYTDDSEEQTVTNFVTEASLSVPESMSGTVFDLVFRSPEALGALVPNVIQQANRPVKITIGDSVLLNGLLENTNETSLLTDGACRLKSTVHTYRKLLDEYVFQDRVPLDLMSLEDALTFLAHRIGVESTQTNFSASGILLGSHGGKDATDFNVLIEPGDKAGEWFDRLLDDYAPNWYAGARPTATDWEFYALSEADLGSTPIVTIYQSREDAVADSATNPFYCRTFQQDVLECVANEVRVTGWNPKTQKPIQSWKEDYASIDPTTVPSSRPLNHVGARRRLGIVDPAISSQVVLDDVVTELLNKHSQTRIVAQIESDLLLNPATGVPLWRGDPVRIYGRGIYRILTLGCDFIREISAGVNSWHWREGTYSMVKIGDEP